MQRALRDTRAPAAVWRAGRLVGANAAYLSLAGRTRRELLRGDLTEADIFGAEAAPHDKIAEIAQPRNVSVHLTALPAPQSGAFADVRIDLEGKRTLSLLLAGASPPQAEAPLAETLVSHGDLLVREVGEMVFTAGPTGLMQYVSPALYDFTNIAPRPDAEGLWSEIIHPDDQARVFGAWRACLRTSEVLEIDFRVRRRDGQHRWMRTRIRPVEHGDHSWFGVLVDIHDLKVAKGVLDESEARFRATCDTAPYAIRLTDADRRTLYVNHAWCELAGASPDDVLGDGWLNCLHPDDLERVCDEMSAARRQPLSVRYRVIDRLGRERPVLDSMVPRLGQDGLFLGHLSVLTEADAAPAPGLDHDLARLARLGAAADMAPAIAQEMNQPLAAAANYAYAVSALLEDGERIEVGKVRDLVQQVMEQVLRAGQLVRRLREFTANDPVGVRREDLCVVVEEAHALVQAGLGQPGLQFQLSLPPGRGAFGVVDRVQIQQVIVNLARGAIESSEGERRRRLNITLDTASGGGWLIALDCTGPDGKPFPSRPLERPGGDEAGGVAFAVSRMIVEAHGGRIWRAGDGPVSQFRVTLPAAPDRDAGLG